MIADTSFHYGPPDWDWVSEAGLSTAATAAISAPAGPTRLRWPAGCQLRPMW